MANELELKYGCNPNQKPARIFMQDGSDLPIKVLCGRPGYINFLDAFNGWQLVRELKAATGLPAAASFKHVSPAGAAVGLPLTDTLKKIYFTDNVELSPLACAYARARGADRMSSFGDWISLSDVCDLPTAQLIAKEVSDGIIAPGYTEEALAVLKGKKKGNYNIVEIDPNYEPAAIERKDVFGITFEQGHNNLKIDSEMLSNLVTENKNLPEEAKRDLVIALITLKYTQSNSVCYAVDGQVIGVGAGQQSRIHCTRLAGNKADIWHLRQHPKVLGLQFVPGLGRANRDNAIDVYISDECEDVLGDDVWQNFFTLRPEPLTAAEKKEWLASFTGVSLGSDAFFPFGDNVERARRSGVSYIAQPGGSIRDDQVIETCNRYGIAMAFTGIRLFHH
ncbi:phosphoribosylaminoimidazolecarboxamide formyltransferase [Angelakisella massiliensis]|uniref:phosphoribosylaminoimidazolecarboxamide formyltransferase n=1 Tax=Angelakisella massiliensis TaxID=1871018 RepID=UPI0024B14807|nr:phosphoribosylaminoimidazolecarboxamide formyltransferase [Angelakisella massiliensis]